MQSNFVLITGAAGFIGSHLAQSLLNQDRNVIVIDCFLPNLYSAQTKRKRWKALHASGTGKLIKLQFDMRVDDFSILNKYSIDSIFNLAAMPGLMENWAEFETYYNCNLQALHRLLEYARTLRLKSVVHASTSSVYGKYASGQEDQELKPISPYGVSKLAAEKLSLAYLEEFSIPVKILRYFSVYGPGQRPDMAYSKIIKAIDQGLVFKIFGDGLQTRTNTFVGDIVTATCLSETFAQPGDVLNISGIERVSLLEAISAIERHMGKKLDIEFSSVRKGDQQQTSGDCGQATSKIGWSPKTPFEEGIRLQIVDYLTDPRSYLQFD